MEVFKFSEEKRQGLLENDKEKLVDSIEKAMGLVKSLESLMGKKDAFIEGLQKEFELREKYEEALKDQVRILQEEVETWRLLCVPPASLSDQ